VPDWLLQVVLFFVVAWIFFRLVRPFCRSSSLAGGIVVVTGCDYGFGRVIALRMHTLGATVFAGCLNREAATKLTSAVTDDKARMRAVVLDVTKQGDVDAVCKAVVEAGLPVRAVINNAGISAFGWAEMLPMKRYEANTQVNYLGTVRVTQAFLPLLRASKGRLVNMGSIGARMPSAFGSAYLSTKAAMVSYSECVRQEVHRFGVTVSLVEPGFFATELLANGSSNGAADSLGATEEALAAYPSYAKKMEATAEPIRMLETLNGGAKGLDHVTDCCVDAVLSWFPLSRYVVGWDARVINHFLVYVPDWIVDNVQTAQG